MYIAHHRNSTRAPTAARGASTVRRLSVSTFNLELFHKLKRTNSL